MRILFYVPNYVHNYLSGDSVMAHQIATYLHSQGDEVTVMLNKDFKPFEIDGVKVIPRNSGLMREMDAVFCQLDTTGETFKLATIPIFWVMHNTFEYPTVKNNPQINVVYNSEAAVGMMGWINDYTVLTPPLDLNYYSGSKGEYITLINCNENKGGKFVYEIAKRMPDKKFLFVMGAYGTQFLPIDSTPVKINIDNKPIIQGLGHLDNVTVLENQPDIRKVYKQTRILLMPSIYESWGKVGSEAMCSSIPVIANPTFGLVENLGKGGIFVPLKVDDWVKEITKLDSKKEYSIAAVHAKKRAIELAGDAKLERLRNFVKKKVHEHRAKKEYV
jgi:glycosyltransferase involved in cell wall biosynthesis